jgi:hypothetical protein
MLHYCKRHLKLLSPALVLKIEREHLTNSKRQDGHMTERLRMVFLFLGVGTLDLPRDAA